MNAYPYTLAQGSLAAEIDEERENRRAKSAAAKQALAEKHDQLDREAKAWRTQAIEKGIKTSAGQKDYIADQVVELLIEIRHLEILEWDARENYRNIERRSEELDGIAATLRTEMKLAERS